MRNLLMKLLMNLKKNMMQSQYLHTLKLVMRKIVKIVQNNQIMIRQENAEDSYCMDVNTKKARAADKSMPKSKVKIVYSTNRKINTYDNREKNEPFLISGNLSQNSNSEKSLLTKPKDNYQHTWYQGRFIGVQKYQSKSPKKFIYVGEVYKSQNLNNDDCTKIIKELRKRMRKKEELTRLQQVEVDEEVILMIRNLGYKQSDIGRDLKVPGSAINNLYQVFQYRKEKQRIEEEINIGMSLQSKPMYEYMGDNINSYSNFDEDNISEDHKKSSMEEMADRFFKLRNNYEHRSRYHKIKFNTSKK